MMIARRLTGLRVSGVLLMLIVMGMLLPNVSAFTNDQAASLVLGQRDFASNYENTAADGLAFPAGVVVDPISGKVFVADFYNRRVMRFAGGTVLVSGAAAEGVLGQPDFTRTDSATTATGMAGPAGMTMDTAGRLWVTDPINNRVLRFDHAATKLNGAAADGVLGQRDFTSTHAAQGANGMQFPTDVATDALGQLWVIDYSNRRILRFDQAAAKANGAAADSVLGQPDFVTTSPSTTARGMQFPSGIAIDSAGRLWSADSGNARVLRFDDARHKGNGAAADGVLGQPDFTHHDPAVTAKGMTEPNGVVVDRQGRLWVVDSEAMRVLRFDGAATLPNGAAAHGVIGQWEFSTTDPAVTASGLNFPLEVAVDAADNLWVADSHNNRVLRFDAFAPTTVLPRLYLPLTIR